MNSFSKRDSRSMVLISATLLAVFVGLWDLVGNYAICDSLVSDRHAGQCPSTLAGIESVLLPIIPFFIFSLITYFLRKEVFATWIKFAAPWAVVSMLLVALAPTYGAGGQFAMPDLSYTKDMAVFLTTAVAVVVSLLIVVIRSIWLKAQSK